MGLSDGQAESVTLFLSAWDREPFAIIGVSACETSCFFS
jgi:hypothetical protein